MDKLLWQCAKLVVEMQSGSTSNIQRRLNIGYNDAGNAMDELERMGIVGATNGSQPRKVFVSSIDELKKFFDANFIAEAESPFIITKNEFYSSYDVTNGCVFEFTNGKDGILDKKRFFFLVNYEHGEFVLQVYSLGTHELKKGTIIHFQFQNNQVLTYEIKMDSQKAPAKINVSIDDLIVFEKQSIKAVLVDFKKYNDKVLLYSDIGSIKYSESKQTLTDFIRKVVELNPSVLQNQTKNINTSFISECYVYLMVDLANNFYKIGISNDLQIRESTLQSEKPTIEIITSKKFNNRKIASVFEKTLHSVYEAKRIRGEWFNLDASELNEVIITLKS